MKKLFFSSCLFYKFLLSNFYNSIYKPFLILGGGGGTLCGKRRGDSFSFTDFEGEFGVAMIIT